ncbi:MAG: HyaD/HybD family hydrogenase maturation endopeptidase [Duodenibacillus sp.]|jgi:hydrogenase maturation protease|nr:HyaD/HybD family hydrogenase maturation endopeptidase [Duodenibacillus sp.]
MNNSSCGTEVLVLGIGNLLWADEGFGVRAIEAFQHHFDDHPSLRLMDGGTLGHYLINEVMDAKRILLFDCCDLKSEPGTLRLLRDDEIKIWSSTKISAHQTGMNDVLATAAIMGYEPAAFSVVAIQPQELNDYGASLTESVKAQIPAALELAAQELSRWGYDVKPRQHTADNELMLSTLTIERYENERPSAEDAPRDGDARYRLRNL